jgi:tRNA threonylcarbamoyladenosine biosynthesis protein TsaB
MTDGPVLAVSGSNVTGDAPFSCALWHEGRLVAAQSPAGGRGDLAGLVDGICRGAALPPAAVRAVRIDLGPGSYTGLRVAVTFVRSLQQWSGVHVTATDSLSLLATAGLERAGGRRLRPLLDARRERVHTAVLQVDAGGRLAITAEPQALPLPEVLAATRGDDLFVVPTGLPAVMLAALRSSGAEILEVGGVTAKALFCPALSLVPCAPADLLPRYLMGSYAE